MKNNWIRLDNAAKIFPAAAHGSDTQVFRMSCQLTQPVRPDVLQRALDETVAVFPIFKSVMKHGVFWYYLEFSGLHAQVAEECRPPCSAVYDKDVKTLLFEVSYYRCRVNLEVFHVLTDGTGAMRFLTTLITKYLSLLTGIDEPPLSYDASRSQMDDDSFSQYTTGVKPTGVSRAPKACKLRGNRYTEKRLKLISGTVSVNAVRTAAKDHGATVSVFLSAVLMCAISQFVPVRARKRPVVLSIPVNLRNIFPSASARNFFGVFSVAYDFSGDGELDSVITSITDSFREGLKQENLTAAMDAYSAMERNPFARITPLFLKNIVLRAAYLKSRSLVTAAMSNVGIVEMPEQFMGMIDAFYLYSGTDGLQTCICSFGDRMSINFTSPFVSTDVQRQFFRMLKEMGIDVELSSNMIDEEWL